MEANAARSKPKDLGPKYIKNYDSLRAIALLAVSFYHLIPGTVSGGFLGVVLFFVFAGFLTSRSLMRCWTHGQTFDLKRYYVDRILKLYPALILFLVITLLYTYLFMTSRFAMHRSASPSVLFGYNNYYQVGQDLSYFDQHGRFDAYVHIWALSVEFQFYLFFPLICVTLKERFQLKLDQLGQLLLLLGFASYLYSAIRFRGGVDPTPIYYSTLARLYQFLIPAGLVFIHGRRKPMGLPKPVRRGLQLALLTFLIASFFFYRYDHPLLYSMGMPAFTLFSLAYLWLGRFDDAAGIFKLPVWSAITQRSYSLYLWQYATMVFVSAYYASKKATFFEQIVVSIVVWIFMSEASYLLLQGGLATMRRKRAEDMTLAIRKAGLSIGDRETAKQNKVRGGQIQSLLILGGAVLLAIFFVLPLPRHAQTVFDQGRIEQAREEASRIAESQALERTTTTTLVETSLAAETTTTTAAAVTAVPTVPVDPLTGPFSEVQLQWLSERKVTLIGDSVAAMAAPELRRLLPGLEIYAEVNRQMWDAPGILSSLNANGSLGEIVVIALGTNGAYNVEWLERIQTLVPDRPLIFINSVMPNDWENQVNQTVGAFVANHELCYLVDWYEHAKERTDLLYSDFTHPVEGVGTEAYANLLMWKLLEIGKQVV